MVNFTLIAYKPDSDDYCRGCHMASYSSDFELFNTQSEEELISWWAHLMSMNAFMDTGEEGYQFTLLINGIHSDNYMSSGDDWEEKTNYINGLKARAQTLASEEIEQRKVEEAETKRKQEESTRAYNERVEREQYQRLKQKFGEQS